MSDDFKGAVYHIKEADENFKGAVFHVKWVGGGGGGDQHNLGYYATESALTTAHPTATDGDWAIVGSTDTVWVWDSDTNAWVDTGNAGIELPDQTGNAGKFLTTDGTDASWSDKPLVNTATGTNALTVGGVASTYNQVTNIGLLSQAYSYNNVLVGYGTSAYRTSVAIGSGASAGGDSPHQKQGNVSIGYGARTRGDYSVAIGCSAKADANGAIQITATNVVANLTNSDANTFKVGNANGNFEIMSADGTIPTGRLTKVNTTITLTAADWSSKTQTANITGMTETGVVLVSPAPADQADYVSAGIICTAQAAGTLTFTCDTVPSGDIDVNVVML